VFVLRNEEHSLALAPILEQRPSWLFQLSVSLWPCKHFWHSSLDAEVQNCDTTQSLGQGDRRVDRLCFGQTCFYFVIG